MCSAPEGLRLERSFSANRPRCLFEPDHQPACRRPLGSLAAECIQAYVPSIGHEVAVTDQRHVRLFRNGRNQAVRIPVEFELPGNEAIMHRDGDRLIIEPMRKRGLVALLKTMKPIEEDFPEIDDPPPAPERPL